MTARTTRTMTDPALARLRPEVASILCCPVCEGTLDIQRDSVRCNVCTGRWPRSERGVPLFRHESLRLQAESGERYQLNRSGLGDRLRRWSAPPGLGLDLVTGRFLHRMGIALGERGTRRPVLNVGSGARLTDSMRRLGSEVLRRTVHVDVTPQFQLVEVVADAGCPWPFRAESVDAVVASAVLQCLYAPSEFAQQADRVLAPGGWLFVSVPMLQPQMEDFDCCRWTAHGLRQLFDAFEVVDLRATAGPATVLGRMLTESLAIGSSLALPRLWGPARTFWGWIFWPMKHADRVLLRHPRSLKLASAVALLARKHE